LLKLRKQKIIILCYHSIGDDGWDFSITKEEFKKQMLLLSEDRKFITLSELDNYLKGRIVIEKPSVAITFDDGYKNIMQVADFLESRNIMPTVFLLANPAEANRDELGNSNQFLSKTDIKTLISKGWEIGCHTQTHSDVYKLLPKQLYEEIFVAKKTLEKSLARSVKYIAYPKGRYTPESLKYVEEAKYKLGLSMDDGEITSNISSLTIPRIGIDGTHSLAEFKLIASPLNVLMRKFLRSRLT
jgi:peptidoglycan/xylan/chitin deacetylase (PgdA/CDA1 family)